MMSCTRLEGCGAGIVQYQYDVSGHLHATAGIPPTQTRVDLSVQLLVFSQSRYEWATPCNSVQLRATPCNSVQLLTFRQSGRERVLSGNLWYSRIRQSTWEGQGHTTFAVFTSAVPDESGYRSTFSDRSIPVNSDEWVPSYNLWRGWTLMQLLALHLDLPGRV